MILQVKRCKIYFTILAERSWNDLEWEQLILSTLSLIIRGSYEQKQDWFVGKLKMGKFLRSGFSGNWGSIQLEKGELLMTGKKLETLGLVLLVCLFCFSLSAQGQSRADDGITSNVKITIKKTLSDEEHRALSEAAGRLLSHVNLARQAIADNKLDAAKEQVDKGLTLVKIIENAAPTYEIDAKIKSGDTTLHRQAHSGAVDSPNIRGNGPTRVSSPTYKTGEEGVCRSGSGKERFSAGRRRFCFYESLFRCGRGQTGSEESG